MIPQEKSEAVTRGLREAFGVDTFEDIHDLTGGRGSNPVFRIIVRGSPFLLRINSRAGDIARHFTCMTAAAEAGLAPHVWYTNVEDRLAITDFVETAPFPAADALVRIPAVLRRLHALPPFPGAPHHLNTTCVFLINQCPALDAFVQSFRAANILPADQCEELLAGPRSWLRFIQVTVRTWCRVTTTCSSPTTSCSMDGASGWRTGKRRSSTTGTPTWRLLPTCRHQ